MDLDLERIRKILSAKHSYYGGSDIPKREDSRWDLGPISEFIGRYLAPTDRVIDLGCGKGHILMGMRHCFQSGLGIDNDPEHIQMAETAKREQGIQNVEFRLLDFPTEAGLLESESFDMVISIRGALYDTEESVQAAHRLLRRDGLLFCEEIGEIHYHEEDEIFDKDYLTREKTSTLKRYRDLLEKNGFETRLAADVMGKVYFPDIYAWLQYYSNIWSWMGVEMPEAHDPRIGQFAERNTVASGEVAMTWHCPCLGCVKK